jgi:hypothetical protein
VARVEAFDSERVRTQLGTAPGDSISVTVERDHTTRTVPVPDDLRVAG